MFIGQLFRPTSDRRAIALFACALSLSALAVCLWAAGAEAVTNGSVGIAGTTLTYTPQNAKANDVSVTLDGSDVKLTDSGVNALDDGDGAGGCTVAGTTATCPLAAITAASIDTGDGADTVTIDAALVFPATITTGPGVDAIQGGSGNDTIESGLGDDTVGGGDGIDTADYSAHSQEVTVSLDGVANDGQAGEDDNVGDDVENITGGPKNDVLTGDDGANVLNGGTGADILNGGDGVDLVSYAGRTDSVVANLDGLTGDGAPAEGDTIAADVEGLTGGDGDDTLTGNSGDGTIDGGAGNDTIDGGLGADELIGGSGSDVLSYATRTVSVRAMPDGEVNDGEIDSEGESVEDDDVADDIETIIGGAGNDILGNGPGAGTIDGGPGNDTASYEQRSEPVSLSLNGVADDGEAGEGDTLTGVENLTGGEGDDTLRGDGAANVLSGGDGNDLLDGAGGPDQLLGGEDSDTADYSSRNAALNVDADGLPDDGAFGEHDNVDTDVEGVLGGSGDDTLSGNDGDGTTDGGAGNDRLLASAGDDVLKGGSGIDTADYSVRSAGVTITLDNSPDDGELGAETDNVSSDVEIAIGGSDDDTLGGGDAANTLIGGSGDDTIDGGAGDDTLTGGFDNDDLDGGTGNDLLEAGAGDDSLSGEEGNDRLVGDTGLDMFDGGPGNDLLASRDGVGEDVNCGDGADSADADAFDNLDDDCDVVTGFVPTAAMSISARTLKMSRDGIVIVHLVCVRAPKDCDGKVSITAANNKRLGHKTLGREEFSVFSNDSDDVEITLSKAARKAVIAGKKLPVRIKTVVANTPDVTRTVTIKAPKAKKAKKKAKKHSAKKR